MWIKTKILIVVFFIIGFWNPKVSAQNWYKGNMHTHSLWSDGDDYPEMIADWYKTHGYNFLGFSEHNKLQVGSDWIHVTTKEERETFGRYFTRFGHLVDFMEWPGILMVRLKTLEEYRGLFEEKGKFLILQNEEITSNSPARPLHMLAINIKYGLQGQWQYGKTMAEIIQKTVDKVGEQKNETGQPIIAQLNHPNFWYAVTAADIKPVHDLRFIEVFNGSIYTANYGGGENDSTEVIWDKVNLQYFNEGRPLLFGTAVDDAHNYHVFDSGENNPGRAWIMVNAAQLDPQSLIKSMETGKFYATTGVLLDSLSFAPGKILLRIKKEEGVTYTIEFIGSRRGEDHAKILKVVRGTEAEYVLKRDDLFVRAKIISSKLKINPFKKGDFEIAWTQPVTMK